MSAFATLALKNNANVDVNFDPQSLDPAGVARWNTNEAVFDAKKVATMSVSIPKNGSSVARVKQKIMLPIMDSVDPTKKVSEAIATIEYVFPKNSTSTLRLDLRRAVETLTTNAVTTAAVTNLEGIF